MKLFFAYIKTIFHCAFNGHRIIEITYHDYSKAVGCYECRYDKGGLYYDRNEKE